MLLLNRWEHGQELALIGLLRAPPGDAVRRSPVLSVYYAFMLTATGDVEAIEPWLDAAERALGQSPGSSPPRPDTDDLRTVPATIAVHRALLAQTRSTLEMKTIVADRVGGRLVTGEGVLAGKVGANAHRGCPSIAWLGAGPWVH